MACQLALQATYPDLQPTPTLGQQQPFLHDRDGMKTFVEGSSIYMRASEKHAMSHLEQGCVLGSRSPGNSREVGAPVED